MFKEDEIIEMIQSDDWMVEVLQAAHSLQLPDWWVCAGFVRSKVWDVKYRDGQRTLLDDIDVIYYDNELIDESIEKKYEKELYTIMPGPRWSVKNQARMHTLNGVAPYISSEDGISKFPETATALGVKLDQDGYINLTAPWGTEDVWNGVIRPTPPFRNNSRLMPIFEMRLDKKNWNRIWPALKISRE